METTHRTCCSCRLSFMGINPGVARACLRPAAAEQIVAAFASTDTGKSSWHAGEAAAARMGDRPCLLDNMSCPSLGQALPAALGICTLPSALTGSGCSSVGKTILHLQGSVKDTGPFHSSCCTHLALHRVSVALVQSIQPYFDDLHELQHFIDLLLDVILDLAHFRGPCEGLTLLMLLHQVLLLAFERIQHAL